jgi:DNA-binding LacI/PurR family transcriptional regulator
MKAKPPARIWDVARLARVSPGTVSRALAGSPQVKPDTARRVLEAAQALHYRPNLAARRLSTGKTLSIAVLVPFFTRPSVSERLNGAVGALADTPYDLVVHNVASPRQRQEAFERFPDRHQVDGVLVISLSPNDSDVARVQRAGVPVVLIDAEHRALDVHRIVVDDVAGGRAAAEHLLGLGHRRIGFVGDLADNPFHFTSSRDRAQGCASALAAAGLPFPAEHHLEGEHDLAEARRLALLLLPATPRPSACWRRRATSVSGCPRTCPWWATTTSRWPRCWG